MSRPRVHLAIVAITLLLAGYGARAQQHHVIQPLAGTTWGPAPNMLPPGAEIAVLSGNPMAAGAYAIRLKFPANYAIPAHSHPTDENVTVVSGTLFMGMGTTLDKTASTALPVGGYALMPANANHYAYTTQPTSIVLFGQGPVEFKYVNPNDDPRTAAAGRR